MEILLIRIAYRTKRITCFFFLFVPSRQGKGALITHHTVCYSLSSSVTVLIDWLLFDLSIRNASFYIVPNDDQWNACAVSWINKPLNMLVTALASVRCCPVQSLSIVVWCYPVLVLQRNLWGSGRFDSLLRSSMNLFQRLASTPHVHGEINYCAFITLFCKNRQPDEKPTDWM